MGGSFLFTRADTLMFVGLIVFSCELWFDVFLLTDNEKKSKSVVAMRFAVLIVLFICVEVVSILCDFSINNWLDLKF